MAQHVVNIGSTARRARTGDFTDTSPGILTFDRVNAQGDAIDIATLPGSLMASGNATGLRKLTIKIWGGTFSHGVLTYTSTSRVEYTLELGGSGSQRLATAFENSPRLLQFTNAAGNVRWLIPGPNNALINSGDRDATEPYTWTDRRVAAIRDADTMCYALGTGVNTSGSGFASRAMVVFGDGATPLPVDPEPVVASPTLSATWDNASLSSGVLSFSDDVASYSFNGRAAQGVFRSFAWEYSENTTAKRKVDLSFRIFVSPSWITRFSSQFLSSPRAFRIVFLGGLAWAKAAGPNAPGSSGALSTGWNIDGGPSMASRPADGSVAEQWDHFSEIWYQARTTYRKSRTSLDLDDGIRSYARPGIIVASPVVTAAFGILRAVADRAIIPNLAVAAPTLDAPLTVPKLRAANPMLAVSAPVLNMQFGVLVPGIPITPALTLTAAIAMPLSVVTPPPIAVTPVPLGIAAPILDLPLRIQAPAGVRIAPLLTLGAPSVSAPLGIDAAGRPVQGATPILHALVETTFGAVLTLRSWTGRGSLTYDGQTWSDEHAVIEADGLGTSIQSLGGRVAVAMPPGANRDAIREFAGLAKVRAIAIVSVNNGATWQAVRTRRGVMSAPQLLADRLTFQLVGAGNDLERARAKWWTNASQQRISTGDLGLQYMAGLDTKTFIWPHVEDR